MTPSRPFVTVIGSLNMDIVVEADRAPLAGETVLGRAVHLLAGGKGANQAVALARLGARTAMIGCLGQDAFGEQLLQGLQAEGIRPEGIRFVADAPTGTAQIVLAQGDNRIIVVPGANDRCSPDDILRHEALIDQADAVLLQLEIPLETVEAAVSMARSRGKLVILNPAPVRELPDSLLKQVDVLTPNETELARLAGMTDGHPAAPGGDSADPASRRAAMQALIDRGVRCVITTLGPDGAVCLDARGHEEKVDGHRVEAVDTTGAGDCFNGALAHALASGRPLAEAMAFANRAAALAVTRLGAQTGMPTLAEVERFPVRDPYSGG